MKEFTIVIAPHISLKELLKRLFGPSVVANGFGTLVGGFTEAVEEFAWLAGSRYS